MRKSNGILHFYKADTETVDFIPAAELTITFVCYHYPRTMLQKLQRDRQITVENMESGIYYLMGDAIPIQLIIVPRLSKTNNYWLNNLRNDLKSGGEIRNFIEKYGENKNSKLYQALADTIMRANWQELKEERKMCEALRELFADDLRESREEGIINMPKQKLCIPCAGSPLLCSYAGLVLQRKCGCIMLFVARQGERAYADEIF